jgi:peptidoglycan/LPS O-acetylase OafA/YrhL
VDGLRLVAALMVAAYHFVATGAGSTKGAWETSTTKVFPAAHHLAQYGYLGVEIFFAVCGFAICMSGWGRTMRQFTASRISRLYPTLAGVGAGHHGRADCASHRHTAEVADETAVDRIVG